MIERFLNKVFKKTIKTTETNEHGFLPSERRTLWGLVIALVILNFLLGFYLNSVTGEIDERIELMNQLLPGSGPVLTLPPFGVVNESVFYGQG